MAVRLPGDRSYLLAKEDRAGAVSEIPTPSPAAPASARGGAKPADAPAWTLAGLAGAGGTAPRLSAVWFPGPENSVLVQARWSALASRLEPLAIRVKPSRQKKEGWF